MYNHHVRPTCSYVLNLSQMMLLKFEGKSIAEAPSVDRLVELRTVSNDQTIMQWLYFVILWFRDTFN